uniref:CCHC-type domain-containing protein n=1 Tax=Tanacetum cinerariifolium TaxID=118510 RepID=A0A6L2LYY0_TANCI|nr:hypothetical protein [Tanacetum cinerariifolium]
MSILDEFMILSGAHNRPQMLEKHLYDSWKNRMKLYMQNREHGRMILESVKHGPLIWPTIEENGLPYDVYSLVNHYRVAKDLWERVQLLMQDQFQVNTKFLNSLLPEWSKFVTYVKLVRDLHTTNFDQLHAYLEQHELHANEIDSGLAVSLFKQGDEPIDAINKIMSFLSTVVSSCFPTTNNQLRNSSNTRQQATIYDGRVTVQPVQERQSLFAGGTSGTRANISRICGNNSGQQRVVKCFNCQGEGHMVRQCPKPKRKKDATWFGIKFFWLKHKDMTIITHNVAYQANDLDVYDSDCDDFFTAKAVLMANLSSYRSYVLFEVPHSENTHIDMLNQTVQDTNYSAQHDAMILFMFEQLSNQVTNCNKVNKDNLNANESLSDELERYKERVKFLEERQNVDLSTREKLIMDDIIREKNAQFANFEKEINYLKQTLSEQSKEKELLTKTFNVFKNESKEKEAKNIDKEIALEKKVKELDNIVCKMETLMREEESRSKMFLKQSDPKVLVKKVNIKPINYVELNRLSKDFGKRFVPLQELFDEQAFLLQTSHPNTDQSASLHVKIEAHRELPKVEAVVQQYHVDKQCFEIQKKQFLIENDRLFDQIISQDIVNIVVNSSMDINTSVNVNSSVGMNDSINYVEMCNKCLKLEAELIKQHNMVEKDEYNRLSKSFSKHKQHCISLELAMQLNKEFFQKHNTSVNQTEPSFDQLFELNNLKAKLQANDITIK